MGSINKSTVAGRLAVHTAHVHHTDPDPVAALKHHLGDVPFAIVLLFITPETDFDRCVADAGAAFPGAEIVACSTAGEISSSGYTEGEIVAAALPASLFVAQTMLIPDLNRIVPDDITGELIRTRAELARMSVDMDNEFAFLTIDGLSLREDEVTAALAPGLGSMPLFGGSAADGRRFKRARLARNGVSHDNAAILVLVRTCCPVKVFSLDHLTPTQTRMVVTKADTSCRLVQEINAEPAAREYARILGKDPEQLDSFTFAAHPVVVRLGGTHHVRAIQRVNSKDELVFFSAIDEGLVLTLAEPEDLVNHLDGEMNRLSEAGPLAAIIACDCFLRRVETQQNQSAYAVSQILRKNRVIGFGTYGEQTDAKHVNQTMTGVAIYYPDDKE